MSDKQNNEHKYIKQSITKIKLMKKTCNTKRKDDVSAHGDQTRNHKLKKSVSRPLVHLDNKTHQLYTIRYPVLTGSLIRNVTKLLFFIVIYANFIH